MLKWKLTVAGVALLSVMGLAGCAPTSDVGAGSANAAGYSPANSSDGQSAAAGSSGMPSASSAASSSGNAAKTVVSVPKGTSSSSLVSAVVAKEVDGDTIHVTMSNGKDETIRMLLIDTPEDVKPNTPVEPFSLDAAAFAKQELPVGRHIYLEEGKPGYTRDKYGRLLAFVYISKTDMYNEDVVRRGLARVGYIYPPNTQHLSDLEADESYAKSHDFGIWSIAGYVTSSGYNMNAVPAGYSEKGTSPGTGTTTASGGASYGTTGTKSSSSSRSTSSSSAVGGTSTGGTPSHSGTTSTGSTSTSGLTVVSSSLSVARGDYASVTVRAGAGASGSIEVDYKSGPSHASGLGVKTADASGNISWRFEVGTSTTKGNWPVIIRVGGKTLRLTLTVK